jgi:hypothetical protein
MLTFITILHQIALAPVDRAVICDVDSCWYFAVLAQPTFRLVSPNPLELMPKLPIQVGKMRISSGAKSDMIV